MCLSRTSEWKVMTIGYLESFCLSISSMLVYYVPESDIHVKSYDNLNFSRASVVQFYVSRYVMRLNRISVWNVMTIWISWELPFFDSERLSILSPQIEHPCEKLWAFDFLESFHFSIRASRYIMSPNRTFEWKVMIIWISRELSMFNFERLDILYPKLDIRVKCYDHLNFSRAFNVQFWASRYVMRLNRTSVLKVMTISISIELMLFNFKRRDILCAWITHMREKLWPLEFEESFRCSISSVSICYVPESDIRVKSYDHLNFGTASVVQFHSSRYIIFPNQTSELKVMTIWISRELLLFNFQRLDMWCA